MIKKNFVGLCCVMVAIILVGCVNNYDYKEGDFSLEITVDKTTVAAGETIEVTSTFKNLSGKDLYIEMPTPFQKTIKSTIGVFAFPESKEWIIAYPSIGGPCKKVMLRKNEIVRVSSKFPIPLSNDTLPPESSAIVEPHDVVAHVAFCVGRDYKTWVELYSETVKILVE